MIVIVLFGIQSTYWSNLAIWIITAVSLSIIYILAPVEDKNKPLDAIEVAISSSNSYTLNVGPNRRVYMGYRVMYNVERGTREYYEATTGKVISSNSYTVKSPSYGEYKLIDN